MNFLRKRIEVFLIITIILLSYSSGLETIQNHDLHNPCALDKRHLQPEPRRAYLSLDDIADSELTGLMGTPGNKVGLTLLRELITKSTFLQSIATNVIRMNLIEECTQLRLPDVSNVPNGDQINSKSLLKSIEWMYTSLTNQTAHTFLIWQKQLNYSHHNCTVHKALDVPLSQHKPIIHSRRLAQHYMTIAVNLKDLMCIFNQLMTALNIDLKSMDLTDRVMAQTITDSAICSRKAVLDCQIMKSSIVLLANMNNFFRERTVQLVTSMGVKT